MKVPSRGLELNEFSSYSPAGGGGAYETLGALGSFALVTLYCGSGYEYSGTSW
jgi:hypothetical protein